MIRGLFTNKTVRNLLDPSLPPGQSIHAPSGERLPLWRAVDLYRASGDPVLIVAGDRYCMGSSRDWAAKGAALLGARAVLATSFERIHRSNLVNMGVLPLRLPAELHPSRLLLVPGDRIEVDEKAEMLTPRAAVPVTIHRVDGSFERFTAPAAVETGLEVKVLIAGGIIPLILQAALHNPKFNQKETDSRLTRTG